jgi:hypothetical protein
MIDVKLMHKINDDAALMFRIRGSWMERTSGIADVDATGVKQAGDSFRRVSIARLSRRADHFISIRRNRRKPVKR